MNQIPEINVRLCMFFVAIFVVGLFARLDYLTGFAVATLGAYIAIGLIRVVNWEVQHDEWEDEDKPSEKPCRNGNDPLE